MYQHFLVAKKRKFSRAIPYIIIVLTFHKISINLKLELNNEKKFFLIFITEWKKNLLQNGDMLLVTILKGFKSQLKSHLMKPFQRSQNVYKVYGQCEITHTFWNPEKTQNRLHIITVSVQPTVKADLRLPRCTDWSKFSLIKHIQVAAQLYFEMQPNMQ